MLLLFNLLLTVFMFKCSCCCVLSIYLSDFFQTIGMDVLLLFISTDFFLFI